MITWFTLVVVCSTLEMFFDAAGAVLVMLKRYLGATVHAEL
jgi:hypothetical protein